MTQSLSSLWRNALIPANALLHQVISNLSDSGMQIALVTAVDDILIGTITDGDVRRGLLRGLDLNSPIDSIIHREAMVVPPQMGRDMVLHLMQANAINALPIVDNARRIVGLHLLNEMLAPANRPNTMVIMAGGQGVRLRPHTENCPKPLLPIGGKPMLEHIIDRAKAEGFRHFVIAVHYLGKMIEDYFGDGNRWEVQIEYLREESPLGTAGALGLLNPHPSTPFVISNGDVLTDIHYGELLDFHCRHGAAGTMAVRLYEWQNPFGVVHINSVDIIGFEEKPTARSHINAGVYVLEPTSLGLLNGSEHCDMPALFSRLREGGARTIVYPMHEPWLDIGRQEDLNKAEAQREK